MSELPPELLPLLVAQWIQSITTERFGFHQFQQSGGANEGRTFTFGDPASEYVTVGYRSGTWSVDSASGVRDAAAVLEEALAHAQASDTGPDVVYRTILTTDELDLTNPAFFLQFMRQLGDQVRIDGRMRLSDRVILDFGEAGEAARGLFAPTTEIEVTLFAPGPVGGPLTQRVSAGMTEVVSAICTVALGRVVRPTVLHVLPAGGEEVERARALRWDEAIPGLTRAGVSLDVFGDLPALAGADGMLRARGALLSYRAALEQRSADVAMMLLVTSVEALIAPRPDWGKQKVTKRFIRAAEDLCTDVLDQLVAHANVEEAFGVSLRGSASKRRRDLLDSIYSLRSNPTHLGLGPSPASALLELGDAGSMRVALLSDLAVGALLAYLKSPRSYLIGHPDLEAGSEDS